MNNFVSLQYHSANLSSLRMDTPIGTIIALIDQENVYPSIELVLERNGKRTPFAVRMESDNGDPDNPLLNLIAWDGFDDEPMLIKTYDEAAIDKVMEVEEE